MSGSKFAGILKVSTSSSIIFVTLSIFTQEELVA
jgi:hypothetical protein